MDDVAEKPAWRLVLAAAALAAELDRADEPGVFGASPEGGLRRTDAGDPDGILNWQPGTGWSVAPGAATDDTALLDLYLPIASATREHPITIGHLGQSLDGFIATHSGESRFVTGRENLLHMHRLRALCDAVVVGAGTVAADDPQLTTRLLAGPSPLRVILDPSRRLQAGHRVFQDAAAETLYLCARHLIRPGETRIGLATIVGLDEDPHGPDVLNAWAVMSVLRARGCARVFVEGGGVTVSMFLEANVLDRLHVAVAPLLIGDGRPAIRLPPRALLGDCRRPPYRVFRMGGDVLFDCALGGASAAAADAAAPPGSVARVI
jgi:riboflavin-specific deaminase-like protein